MEAFLLWYWGLHRRDRESGEPYRHEDEREAGAQPQRCPARAGCLLRARGTRPAEEEAAIGDLIVDLLHLAEEKGVLPSAMEDFVAYRLGEYQYESDPDNEDEEV